MDTITLLDRFAYVSGSTGDTMYTPWVHFPANFRQAEYWVDVKTFDTGSISVELESSTDTTSQQQVNASALAGPGLNVNLLTANLGPLVRLKLSSSGAAARAVFSIWLVPKQD